MNFAISKVLCKFICAYLACFGTMQVTQANNAIIIADNVCDNIAIFNAYTILKNTYNVNYLFAVVPNLNKPVFVPLDHKQSFNKMTSFSIVIHSQPSIVGEHKSDIFAKEFTKELGLSQQVTGNFQLNLFSCYSATPEGAEPSLLQAFVKEFSAKPSKTRLSDTKIDTILSPQPNNKCIVLPAQPQMNTPVNAYSLDLLASESNIYTEQEIGTDKYDHFKTIRQQLNSFWLSMPILYGLAPNLNRTNWTNEEIISEKEDTMVKFCKTVYNASLNNKSPHTVTISTLLNDFANANSARLLELANSYYVVKPLLQCGKKNNTPCIKLVDLNIKQKQDTSEDQKQQIEQHDHQPEEKKE